jgi:hypothetical protein
MVALPDVMSSFAWVQESWGPALVCEPLAAVARHVFTTRQLRLSTMEGAQRWRRALG